MKYHIGVDLGGTNIAVGLVDENYKVIEKHSTPTKPSRGHGAVISDIEKTIYKVLDKAGVKKEDCVSVGVGNPGTVDEERGIVIYSNNLVWHNVHIVDELKARVGLPVFVSNDANCAALGEVLAGAAKGAKHAVLITLGTGVGSGVIIDGKVFSGGHPGGTELGHTLLKLDGALCTCGRRGCLEAYASATALIRQTKEAMEKHKDTLMWEVAGGNINRASGRLSFDVAKKGDKVAQQVVDNYSRYLSEGLIDIINIFRPDVIILGGGIANEGDNLIIPLQKLVREGTFGGTEAFLPEIVKATLGDAAGIVGAAMLDK